MNKIIYVFIAITLLVSSCSPNYVANSDYDRGVNLRNYQTFKISSDVPNRADIDPILNNEFNRKRLSRGIEAQLQARGYVETDANPDLLVKFYIRVKDKQQTQFGGGWGFYPRTNTYTRSYEESTIIIDLVDAKENKLVWQGWSVGEKEYNSKNIEQRLWNKVDQIFRSYPVKPTKEVKEDQITLK